MKFDKKEFVQYLIFAFGLAWIFQIAGSLLAIQGNRMAFVVLNAICMLMPMVAVFLTKKGIAPSKTGITLKLNFKKKWYLYIIAWFLPALITFLGALIYFLIFKEQFDPNCGYVTASMGIPLGADGTIQGLTPMTLVLISCVQALTYAPLVNGIFALGEEIGWRGYLTPVLSDLLGKKWGYIISGIIWGVWHAPVIILAGYEYGTGYMGAPLSGVLAFTLITISLGTVASVLYEKSGSIWTAAIFHGAINGFATIPMCFTDGTMTGYLLGPAPVGLIAAIPLYIAAFIALTLVDNSRVCE